MRGVSILTLAVAMTAASPITASAHGQSKKPLPTCAQLGTDPAYGLVGNPEISNLTVQFTPTAGTTAAYCQLNFTFSGEEGPSDGYRSGQKEEIRIRVGLPLSAADGGVGGVQGAWNGKNRDLGGGGYAGGVGGVTSSTNLGYVGRQRTPGTTARCNLAEALPSIPIIH